MLNTSRIAIKITRDVAIFSFEHQLKILSISNAMFKL